MPRLNVPEARKRILTAAIALFAEQGFDGSSVDEVARRAGVTKSLIYYHFVSKDQILETLVRDSVAEYLQVVRGGEGLQVGPARYYDFAVRNADLMRVLFIESLKKTQERPPLYQLVEALVDFEAGPDEDRDERLVVEFFTSIIPSLAFICFEHSWQGYFGIDQKSLGSLFLHAYSETHGAYHRKKAESGTKGVHDGTEH